jgi:hypothetical protein
MRRVWRAFCSFLIVALLAACTTTAPDHKMSSPREVPALAVNQAALELPLADIHFHPMPFMTPQELLQRMDRLNIRWCGGAGANTPPRDQASEPCGPFQHGMVFLFLSTCSSTRILSVNCRSCFGPTQKGSWCSSMQERTQLRSRSGLCWQNFPICFVISHTGVPHKKKGRSPLRYVSSFPNRS